MSKKAARTKRNSAPAVLVPAPEPQATLPTGASRTTGVLVAQATAFSGPLPPPAILQEYDEVLEGAAERIFKMAETQASHRQELEKRVVKSDIWKSFLGLAAGFLIAALAIIGGSIVAYHGQPAAGVGIGGVPVGALVWAFLKGTSERREEREAKAEKVQRARGS